MPVLALGQSAYEPAKPTDPRPSTGQQGDRAEESYGMMWVRMTAVSGSLVIMVIGMVIINARMRDKKDKEGNPTPVTFGINSNRALGTVLLIPSLVIISVVSNFNPEALAALLGTIAGNILSRMTPGEEERN
jgi:hypothetical protein